MLNPAVIQNTLFCCNYTSRTSILGNEAPHSEKHTVAANVRRYERACCSHSVRRVCWWMLPCQTSQPVSNCSWQPLCSHTHTHTCTHTYTHTHTHTHSPSSFSFHAVTDSSIILRGCSVLRINTTGSDVRNWHLGIRQTEWCQADWQSDSSLKLWEDHMLHSFGAADCEQPLRWLHEQIALVIKTQHSGNFSLFCIVYIVCLHLDIVGLQSLKCNAQGYSFRWGIFHFKVKFLEDRTII